ncbi:MAG: hypothetical protein JWQ97_1731 [Phenylobacterium sp.]|nr:hypothetical protein [Phenylobacterium sp.]
MRPICKALALATVAAVVAPGVASAHDWMCRRPGHYAISYRPVTRYVRRTVIVREQVWRPVHHRVRYYRGWSGYRIVPTEVYYGGGYGYPAYGGWERHHRYHEWRERHRRWDDDDD